ncbi:MAG: hypothetical protein AMXMBFR13_37820 [Phycisphaerae bacterium]
MLVRLFTFAALTFSLQGLPVLCLAGLLEHPCACSEPQEDCHCEHEQDCSSDPCSKILTSQSRSRADDVPDGTSVAVAILDLVLLETLPSDCPGCTESPPPVHLCRHYDTALPLLI